MIHVIQYRNGENTWDFAVIEAPDVDMEEMIQVWISEECGDEPDKEDWAKWNEWNIKVQSLDLMKFIKELGYEVLKANFVDTYPWKGETK